MEHGNYARYRAGCRCDECRAANAAEHRAYRADRRKRKLEGREKPLRVRVLITLDVDAKAWATEYGLEPHEIHRDVREHVTNLVYEHLHSMELLA